MPARSERAPWLFPALLVLAAIAVYANSLRVPFLFDDVAITQNPSIRDLTDLRAVLSPPTSIGFRSRPIANLSAALNYAMGGLDVRGYHAVNVLIHAAAALTLFGLVRRTLERVGPALVAVPLRSVGTPRSPPASAGRDGAGAAAIAFSAALLWTVHPLTTASVTYISQRTESLMALFYLLTLYALVRAAGGHFSARSAAPREPASRTRSRGGAEGNGTLPNPAWSVVAVVACAFGMGTKESMITAPLMALLYDRVFLSGSFAATLRARWRLHAALGLTWLVLAFGIRDLRHHSIGYDFGISAWDYALTQSVALTRYLALAFWPHPLVFDHGPEVIVRHLGVAAPFVLVVLLLVGGAGWLVVRHPRAGFVALGFFLLLAPTSSFLPIAQQPIAENRMYLPLAVVVVGVVLGLHAWLGRRALGFTLVVAVAAAALTICRNTAYASEVAIWSDTVAKRPDNARAHDNLGLALAAAGRAAEALAHHQAAVRLAPDFAEAHNNLGLALARAGRNAEAVAHGETAVKLRPDFFDAWNNLGSAQFAQGNLLEAIVCGETALRIRPDHAEAHNNLALAFAAAGRGTEAVAHFNDALRYVPDSAAIHSNFANTLFQLGRFADAVTHYETALRAEPNSAEIHSNLGITLLRLGRTTDARREFETALRIDPNHPPSREGLSSIR